MTMSLARVGGFIAAIALGLTLAGCGYNNIPTLEEQAKAKWADVQNNYQRRADLSPISSPPCRAMPSKKRSVLIGVVEARAKATQARVDVSQLTDPDKLKQFQDAQNQLSGALGRLHRDQRELSRPQVEPELPGPAIAARRHREPHRGRAPRLHRGGARSTTPS